MRIPFWPRTLAFQLIAVTAAAVVISNLGVAIWATENNLAQNQNNQNDRMIDRATAVATTLRAIPPQSRAIVMRNMGSGIWKFSEIKNRTGERPMTAEESALATRLSDQLPADYPRKGEIHVYAHIDTASLPSSQLPRFLPPHSDTFRAIVPVDDESMMNAVFVQPPPRRPDDLIIATAVGILLASVVAAIMARRVVRPLSELTKAASMGAMSGGVVPRVSETGPEDVRAAASAFNTMTERVTKTLESQRHLLSAVGHDLRTPITAMRINLEFVTDDDLREGLVRNLDELQQLTEQVLGAARGSGGEIKRNVDLSALVESLCTDLDEMGEPVKWDLHAPAPISCRPNEIRRAVRNLVENAVAYGGEADVKIADAPDAYEILVEDKGPGIAEADRQRVFEPFVRLETSRNREGGGTGLGLTLVKAIAEGHGGQVTLENLPAGGLRARMSLPRTPVPA